MLSLFNFASLARAPEPRLQDDGLFSNLRRRGSGAVVLDIDSLDCAQPRHELVAELMDGRLVAGRQELDYAHRCEGAHDARARTLGSVADARDGSRESREPRLRLAERQQGRSRHGRSSRGRCRR